MRRVIAGCVVVLCFAAVGPASAEAKKFASKVAIEDLYCNAFSETPKRGLPVCTQSTFVGHVGSAHAKCKRNRKVKFFKQDELLGTDRTSFGGFSGVRVDASEVDASPYHARVTRRVLRNGDVCKAATSENFFIPS